TPSSSPPRATGAGRSCPSPSATSPGCGGWRPGSTRCWPTWRPARGRSSSTPTPRVSATTYAACPGGSGSRASCRRLRPVPSTPTRWAWPTPPGRWWPPSGRPAISRRPPLRPSTGWNPPWASADLLPGQGAEQPQRVPPGLAVAEQRRHQFGCADVGQGPDAPGDLVLVAGDHDAGRAVEPRPVEEPLVRRERVGDREGGGRPFPGPGHVAGDGHRKAD